MVTAYSLAIYRLAKQRAHHSIAVPPSLSAPCALKLAAQQKPPTKPGTGCAAATNTSNNLNNTAAPRYADSEAQNRNRLRTERMATDRLTRATKSLVWATGVPAIATIALLVVTLAQLSDGHGGTKRSRQPTSWTAGQAPYTLGP
jgi:hypothetical protein